MWTHAQEHEKKQTEKLAIAKTNSLQHTGLVAFYNIQPAHGAGIFLQTWRVYDEKREGREGKEEKSVMDRKKGGFGKKEAGREGEEGRGTDRILI